MRGGCLRELRQNGAKFCYWNVLMLQNFFIQCLLYYLSSGRFICSSKSLSAFDRFFFPEEGLSCQAEDDI